MATIVSFKRVSTYGSSLIFSFPNGDICRVVSLNNGVMVIEPFCGCDIYSLAKEIAGCFEKDSNFYGLKAIEFDFNGAYVSVNAKNANPQKIIQIWKAKMEENNIKAQKAREEYMKTPEYRIKRAKELKEGYRRQTVEKLVKQSIKTEKIQFKDKNSKQIWDNFVKANSADPYSIGVVHYAEYWVKFMQYLMAKHKNVTVSQIANQASQAADIEGITGFMYGCATNILSQVWKHGDELREWHNKKYGYAGKGVANPALLTVNVK